MTRTRPPVSALLLVVGLLAPTAARADIEVEARLEPDQVSIEEAARLVLEIRSDGPQPRDVKPHFELHNLQSMGGPQRSQTFRFMAGRSYHQLRLTYFLRPLSPGPAAVRSIRVEVNRDVYELPPREIEVVTDPPSQGRVPRSQPPSPPRRWPDPWAQAPLPRSRPPEPAEPKVFVRATVTPERPWAGQQVLYRLTLYTQADVASISAREIPPFQGFWAELVDREQQEPELVTVEGETYGRAVILERILVPRRAGSFRIEPATLDLVLRIVERRGFGRTFSRPRQVQRSSNPVTVDVRELPPAPEGFHGAVGDLAVETELGSEEVTVGGSTPLTITYRGSAHLPSLPAPELPDLAGLDVFPPEESSAVEIVGDRLRHTRTWTYTLAPRAPGRFELGPFRIPVYDPRSSDYQTAASDALTLTARVLPASGTQRADGIGTLHPIRSAAVPRDDRSWLSARALPWLFLLPLGLALALRFTGGSRRLGPPGPDGNEEAGDVVQRLRSRLGDIASPEGVSRNDRTVAQDVEDAWRDFLSERWGVSPALPASRWAENLEERRDLIPDGRRLDTKTLAALDEVAREIHYLRHAPQLSDTGSVRRELARRSRRLLRRLS